jgi:GAF domain-containing protein
VEDLTSHLVVRRIGNLLSDQSAVDSLRRLALTHPAVLAVPLVARNEIYGALSLFYCQPRQFSDQDVELASSFADQAALVIENASLRDAAERRLVEVEALAAENARLHEQSEQRASELGALYRADEQIYRSLRLEEVLEALVEVATDLLQPDKVAVGMLEDSGERIVVGAARGFSAATVAESVYGDESRQLRAHLDGGVVVMEDARPTAPARQHPKWRMSGRNPNQMTASYCRTGYRRIRLSYRQSRRLERGEQRLPLSWRNERSDSKCAPLRASPVRGDAEERQRPSSWWRRERGHPASARGGPDAERRRPSETSTTRSAGTRRPGGDVRAQELIDEPGRGDGTAGGGWRAAGIALVEPARSARGFPVLADRVVAAVEAHLVRVSSKTPLIADPVLGGVRFAPEVEAAAISAA